MSTCPMAARECWIYGEYLMIRMMVPGAAAPGKQLGKHMTPPPHPLIKVDTFPFISTLVHHKIHIFHGTKLRKRLAQAIFCAILGTQNKYTIITLRIMISRRHFVWFGMQRILTSDARNENNPSTHTQ